jgi:hypothetical protein
VPLSDIDTLEDIYRRFNNDHPKDFTGHSLSVSDVVILRHGDRQTAHYCDSYGFREVPQFIQERQRQQENPLKTAELSTEQNENMIDGRINNTPSVGELEAKVKAGAEYFQTQAVYEPEKFIKFMEKAKQFGVPVQLGIVIPKNAWIRSGTVI